MKITGYYRLLLIGVVFVLAFSVVGITSTAAKAKPTPIDMVIDSDTGVDDAAAIAYLLDRPDLVHILGITAVAGNTTVENAAINQLLLLNTAHRTDIPVYIGAEAPLVLPASHQGEFVHGPDGLWGIGMENPQDISNLSHDAAGFICDNARQGVTLLALGPLTNLANAVEQCPTKMPSYRIVWLGGAKSVDGEGNTPVSVFNPWFDPDAAQIVLNAGLSITMITTDAARTVTVSPDVFIKIAQSGTPVAKLIAPALQQYASLFATPTGRHGKLRVALFDPTAAIIAVHPDWATSQSGLIVVQTPDGPARGQTIIAFSMGDHLSLLASDAELSTIADEVYSDPTFNLQQALANILARKPDNAQVVLNVNSNRIMQEWLGGMLH